MAPPEDPRPSLSRTPSYLKYAPRRAIASFENLVVLANYDEHLREARRMVWRDRGEPAVEVSDLWECAEHGVRGGFRAGSIAFTLRSGVNLVLLLVRIRSIPRRERHAFVLRALFGEDSFRFGAMLGCFVSVYRTLLNAFPIVFPAHVPIHLRLQQLLSHLFSTNSNSSSVIEDSPSSEELSPVQEHLTLPTPTTSERARSGRLSINAQAHQLWMRKKTRRWHSVVAGAVAGGVAILFEKPGRQAVISQQLFVRGLQGSYNAYSRNHGLHVPNGDVIVFSLACAQIMYAWLLSPETLPRSYVSWCAAIHTASHLPREAVAMNRDLVRTGRFQFQDLDKILDMPDLAPRNATDLVVKRTLASANPPIWGFPFMDCVATHPSVESCLATPFDRFLAVSRWMFPIYGALHLIPALLFKRKKFFEQPARMLLRTAWGTARSSAFLGLFVAIYQSYFCGKGNLYRVLSSGKTAFKPPAWLIALLISKPSYWLGGMLSGLSLFLEAKHRRPELAMYVLPKGLESAWVMARGKGLVFRTGQYGEALLTAIGMGMVMSTYQNDPEHLSGLVRRILYQFIGPN
ncbi:hypothetical protein OF83DRAFT_1066610 [Amylostereum chailletii]|nr:hypothetical protein OF83DRAFT_1066610 [Amylostereum chailletii]